MSFLLITPENRQIAEDLAAYAALPEHHYRPGYSPVPGDFEPHTRIIDSYRVVFTHTVAVDMDSPREFLFRHLSISLPRARAGALPLPLAAWTIASWLGFTGGTEEHGVITAPGRDWGMEVLHEPVSHVVMIQRIGPVPETERSAQVVPSLERPS